jgi:phosphate starvation-inducible PhoH-like protein
MAKAKVTKKVAAPVHTKRAGSKFNVEWKNASQKLAWIEFQRHDIVFLTGPAGVGKTHLAMAFAISEVLEKKKKKIVLTRPIVEAGESLGFLPGEFEDKVHPYMLPCLDIVDKMTGGNLAAKEIISKAIELAPVAYMRGRTFDDSICIFDEAQNATMTQLKLFLTRFGDSSKLILTGDPKQTDLPHDVALVEVMEKLQTLRGVGAVMFGRNAIVRHPLIADILQRLEGDE